MYCARKCAPIAGCRVEGEMLEWLKRHAWKACKLQKGFGGSNPPLSAKIFKTTCLSSLKHGGRKIFAQDAVGRLWGLRRNPPLSRMPVGRLWGIRGGRTQRGRCPRIRITTLAQRATNVSETNKINYKQFNTKNKIV